MDLNSQRFHCSKFRTASRAFFCCNLFFFPLFTHEYNLKSPIFISECAFAISKRFYFSFFFSNLSQSDAQCRITHFDVQIYKYCVLFSYYNSLNQNQRRLFGATFDLFHSSSCLVYHFDDPMKCCDGCV